MDKPYGDMKEHTPSFFKNSSPGNHAFVETKRPTEETDEVVTGGPSASSNSILTEEENFREVNTAKEGWTKSLAFLPRFDSMKIERQLIKNLYDFKQGNVMSMYTKRYREMPHLTTSSKMQCAPHSE